LSNFAPSTITVNGITGAIVEHVFQAFKSTDTAVQKEIASSTTPGRAKRAGRQCNLRPDWEEVKYSVMLDCLKEKFKLPEYQKVLLETGDDYIEEDTALWNDTEWGVGKNGDGKNMLGKALMEVRSLINKGQL